MCVCVPSKLFRLEVIECVAFVPQGDREIASLFPWGSGRMEGCCFSFFPVVWTLQGHPKSVGRSSKCQCIDFSHRDFPARRLRTTHTHTSLELVCGHVGSFSALCVCCCLWRDPQGVLVPNHAPTHHPDPKPVK